MFVPLQLKARMLHVADFSLPFVLLQDNREARAQAAALLPGGSLEPVVAAVERCLHFYITAGQSRLAVRACPACRPFLCCLAAGSHAFLPSCRPPHHLSAFTPLASRALCLQAP